MDRRGRVLLGVGGGIAACKAPQLVRRLAEHGLEVRCALTRSAAAFVAPLTLEVLSQHAVYQQEYLTPTGSGEESHIVAAAWADVLCVAPATAHLLARLALGLADDFLTTTALAFTGPVLLAPAMHSQMWGREVVRRHVEALRRRGVGFAGPEDGPLASGESGIGRMTEPCDIAAAVAALLARRDFAGRRVLITAGPTYEPIDAVRFLGNRSSGKMGFALAAEVARRGADTVLVAGPVALATPAGVERVDVATALEMERAVGAHAPGCDLVVMAAAVSDYRPRRVLAGKHKKQRGLPELELEETPDILAGLPAVAPRALLVGFAAEHATSDGEAPAEDPRAKLARKAADLLVWNDVSRREIGFGADDNEVTVYRRGGAPTHLSRRPKRRLAADLLDLFREALESRERTLTPA